MVRPSGIRTLNLSPAWRPFGTTSWTSPLFRNMISSESEFDGCCCECECGCCECCCVCWCWFPNPEAKPWLFNTASVGTSTPWTITAGGACTWTWKTCPGPSPFGTTVEMTWPSGVCTSSVGPQLGGTVTCSIMVVVGVCCEKKHPVSIASPAEDFVVDSIVSITFIYWVMMLHLYRWEWCVSISGCYMLLRSKCYVDLQYPSQWIDWHILSSTLVNESDHKKIWSLFIVNLGYHNSSIIDHDFLSHSSCSRLVGLGSYFV